MDKAKITEIVHQASLDIKTLFPTWYANREVDKTIITSKIDEWERYIDKRQNEIRIGIITNVRLTEELTENIEKAYNLFHEISKEGESNTHIISDMPHNFIEFILICDIKLCQSFLDFINSTHPTPKPARQEATTKIWALNLTELQQKKYEETLGMGALMLKLQSGRRIGGEKALEEALERAANEKREVFGHTLANHSASLPFEAQQALAEELLTFCQGEYSEEDCAYLRISVARFFQKNSPKPEKQEANTKKWALFYWFLMDANVMPEIRGAKKSLKELAQKHNLGEDNFYQTFNAVNQDRAKNPMKVDILKEVIPMLEEYPEARAKAELELKKYAKE